MPVFPTSLSSFSACCWTTPHPIPSPFIDLVHTTNTVQVIHLEDIISILTVISLIAGLLGLFFASQPLFHRILLAATGLSTLSIFLNVAGLLHTLTQHEVNPEFLLIAAAIVYISNVLIFSVRYWILDFSGQQDRSCGRTCMPVLVFPQACEFVSRV